MAAKDFIVAIELGSSKVTGVAGKKNLDGSISVLAVVKEESSSFIKKGVIYNIDKTAQCLTSIVQKLTKALKTEIVQVYVGVSGQSIRSVRNEIIKELPADSVVTKAMENELMDANRNMKYPDQVILDAAVQEFKVDSQYQIDPVGIPCTKLVGNFLNILQRNTFYKNLNKCFDQGGIRVAEMYLAPLALAESVLTEQERRSGCALVDIGADTTTVLVFTKNILRHLVVIPLGSANITKDIASLQMEEAEAEKMKLKYGSAYTENSEIDNTLKLSIDQERSIDSRKFVEIVEGRMLEIVENVWCQIQASDYDNNLLGGIILTGGGSNMKNIEKAFTKICKIDKIRIAKFVTQSITSSNSDVNAKNGTMNTVLGLLAKGDMNCAGGEVDPNGDLFGTNKPKQASPVPDRPPRQAPDLKPGVIRTEAEMQEADEEARRKREAEEEAARKEEEERRKREAEEKRQNSPLNKLLKGLKKFGRTIIEEEE